MTYNLEEFPDEDLNAYGIEAQHAERIAAIVALRAVLKKPERLGVVRRRSEG